MSQSKRHSLYESITNTAVGYMVAVAANMVVLPLFGFHPSIVAANGMAMAFTGISVVRSYLLRRWFDTYT